MDSPRRFVALLLCLLAIAATGARAQYVFRSWNAAAGLSDDCVRAISVCDDGRILVRTNTGVDLFDGADFLRHTLDRKRAYRWTCPNDIHRCMADGSGLVWLAAPDHLAAFDTRSERFVYDIAARLAAMGVRQPIANLFTDAAGRCFFVTRSGALLYRDSRQRKTVTVETASRAASHGVATAVASAGRYS